ncbi:hypothetical protein [Pelomonas sp. Root1237]|uniref:hypothetical protein n=1 Tax=Pelomonas sp. Root1237 TaxID=1736434 RepID=UPI0012FA76D9|nr:hypothetical protein [Pelomonas sp. Root1237]
MRRLQVEFAPPRRPVAALVALGVASAVITVACGIGAFQAWERRQGLMAQLDRETLEANRLKAALNAQAQHAAAEAKDAPFAQDARAIVQLAAFPIQRALRALEAVAVDGIRLNAIDANAVRGTVDVQLEFDDYKSLIAYLERLNDGEPTQRWSLVTAEASGQRKQAAIRSNWR